MLRSFSFRFASLVVATLALAACATKPAGSRGGGDDVDVDVDVDYVNQRESSRAAASEFAPALRSSDAALRARAVRALGRLVRLDTVPLILSALVDADPDVRVAAAFAAGELDLALDAGTAAHDAIRAQVETQLVQRMAAEQNADVRQALMRALGRVSVGAGLDQLTALASSTSTTDQATALSSLGVAGARRQASRKGDPQLISVVNAALRSSDENVKTAAAYTALRQKLVVDATALDAALSGKEQARIFATRALASESGDIVQARLARVLSDADWRVRVEGLRVLQADHDWHSDAAVDALNDAVAHAAQPGMHHVIAEACLAIAKDVSAERAGAALQAAVTALPAGPSAAQARCTCAVASDVVNGDGGAVGRCTADLDAEQQKKFAVLAVEHARTNTQERASALAAYVNDDNVRVRVAAASALCAIDSDAAADIAATRLLTETDPAVAASLLECFADGHAAAIVRDQTLVGVAQRFSASPVPEAADVLLALAPIARNRPGPMMQSLVDTLAQVPNPRVKDAANNVAYGDRAPGPRAAALPAPSPANLPLAAILHTSRGDVTIAFERELAPRTVKNFVDLAQKGTFQNTLWHRVIGDFVTQGGDPRGDGSGGPGYSVPCEYSDASYTRGALGMAHAGHDTGGSQFFLTHSAHPHLDGRYTLFARVVDGFDVMDALQKDDLLLSVEITTALRTLAH